METLVRLFKISHFVVGERSEEKEETKFMLSYHLGCADKLKYFPTNKEILRYRRWAN